MTRAAPPWSRLDVRRRVPGSARSHLADLHGHRVVLAEVGGSARAGALGPDDGTTLATAAGLAATARVPLVLTVSSSGADVHAGVAALDGWGRAAHAVTRCSGVVPVVVAVHGPALSGTALLLGLADVVVFTHEACAFVSGPRAVQAVMGERVDRQHLGGVAVHARRSGLAALVAADLEGALELLADVLDHLPPHADELPPRRTTRDPADRPVAELRSVLPAASTASYDVRAVVAAVVDEGHLLELHAGWAPNLVTALAHVEGRPVGVVANQPRALAGTLDIAASQKGAAFVALCDAFNVPLLTFVDTPGFTPGRDVEWRGMIRHGAQLAFAYARATVPRVSVTLRKSYGGAYIVMDSKTMGCDLALAWPTAEIAVMGARGAVEILHRRAALADRAELERDYEERLLNPFVAAERGLVDDVIDPADTRVAVAAGLSLLASGRESLPHRRHDNQPL